jgi:putative transposase
LVSKITADTYDAACIESHSLKSQTQGPLAKYVHDVGHGYWRNNMEYKMADRGKILCVADAKFASSKTCSVCGHKMDKMPLSVRNWTCPACGAAHDRDLNAAKNLQHYGAQQVASHQM